MADAAQAAQAMKAPHTCHWPGCTTAVPPRFWGCRLHWYSLPAELRRELWRNYRPGQEVDKQPSAAYMQAFAEALLFSCSVEAARRVGLFDHPNAPSLRECVEAALISRALPAPSPTFERSTMTTPHEPVTPPHPIPEPSIGRIVHVWQADSKTPNAAIVTRVFPQAGYPAVINVAGFTGDGESFPQTSVQHKSEAPEGAYWRWTWPDRT